MPFASAFLVAKNRREVFRPLRAGNPSTGPVCGPGQNAGETNGEELAHPALGGPIPSRLWL